MSLQSESVAHSTLVGGTQITLHSHSGGSDPWTIVKLTGDFTTSLTTNEIVTGLNFAPAANKAYLVYGILMYRTTTATVGPQPGISWPSGLTDGTAQAEVAVSLTTRVTKTWGTLVTDKSVGTGLANTTASHFGRVEAFLVAGATPSGNFQITLASETSGTNVTIRAGSFIMYREI